MPTLRTNLQITVCGKEVIFHLVIAQKNCLCSSCDGRGTDRGAELRHWRETKIAAGAQATTTTNTSVFQTREPRDLNSEHACDTNGYVNLLLEQHNGNENHEERQAVKEDAETC